MDDGNTALFPTFPLFPKRIMNVFATDAFWEFAHPGPEALRDSLSVLEGSSPESCP